MTPDKVRGGIVSPEIDNKEKLLQTIRKITLADGCTKPYQFAVLRLVTIKPEDLSKFGAISLYANKGRLERTSEIDSKCQNEFGKPLNEIDGLYQFSDDKPIAPPLVELFNGLLEPINPENSNIVDGLHRFLDCIENNKPLTIVEITGVSKRHRLPFKSFSPLDVVVTENIPDTKRILNNPDLDPDKVINLYRDLGPLGSHHRDQSYPLLPLVPWDVAPIKREKDELHDWKDICLSLKDYVPPLSSILSRPTLRVVVMQSVDFIKHILNRDQKFGDFQFVFPISDKYSVAPFNAHYWGRSDFYGRATPGLAEGEALLVRKDNWEKTCTKLITLIPNSDFYDLNLPHVDLEKKTLVPIDLFNVKPVRFPKETLFFKKTSRFSLINFITKEGKNSDFIVPFKTDYSGNRTLEQRNISIISTQDQGGLLLGLNPHLLFGINTYSVNEAYRENYKPGDIISTYDMVTGPKLLFGSDSLQTVDISFGKTTDKCINIFPEIIDKVEKTQWYNPELKVENFSFDDSSKAIQIEDSINNNTKWVGQVDTTQLLNLFRDGLIPDPKTIAAVSIFLLQSGKLVLNQNYYDYSLILEEKPTPFGDIFIPPSLPVNESKEANSMKFSSRWDRMDMSFTLTQTNTNKLELRTSDNQLYSIQVSDLIKVLSNSKEFLPFDMESLAHIFSSLIQIGALELTK